MKLITTHPLPESVLASVPTDAHLNVVVARTDEELLRAVEDAEILLGGFGGGNGERFRELLGAARRLKWVHTSSAGVDALLCPELERSGATLTCAKGEVVGSLLAEHAFALALALTRGLVWCARQRHWERGGRAGREAYEIRGRTLGIVGYGGTGQALARRALAFDMEGIAVKRTPPDGSPPDGLRALWGLDQLDRLLGESDVVVATIPATPESQGLFDDARFRRMRPHAVFINVGRGETVVTEDLTRALQERRLGAAGLDVTDPEPLPEGHPLWTMDNVLVTPHIAGNSPQRSARNHRLVAENLRRFLEGRPLRSVVDTRAGY